LATIFVFGIILFYLYKQKMGMSKVILRSGCEFLDPDTDAFGCSGGLRRLGDSHFIVQDMRLPGGFAYGKVKPLDERYLDGHPLKYELRILEKLATEAADLDGLPETYCCMYDVPVICKALRPLPMRRMTNASQFCLVIVYRPYPSVLKKLFSTERFAVLDAQAAFIYKVLQIVLSLQERFGLAHNDLHHNNVLVDRNDQPVLWDFECAIMFKEPKFSHNPECGNPKLVSLEKLDPGFDVQFFLCFIYWNLPGLHADIRAFIAATYPDLCVEQDKEAESPAEDEEEAPEESDVTGGEDDESDISSLELTEAEIRHEDHYTDADTYVSPLYAQFAREYADAECAARKVCIEQFDSPKSERNTFGCRTTVEYRMRNPLPTCADIMKKFSKTFLPGEAAESL
jgi:hypothetical protein